MRIKERKDQKKGMQKKEERNKGRGKIVTVLDYEK